MMLSEIDAAYAADKFINYFSNTGRIVDNGVYFIRLEYDEKVEWIKLIVVK